MYVHIRIFVSINAYFFLQREGTWTIENWATLQNQGKNRNCPSSQNHYLFFSTFKYLHHSLKYKDYYMLYFIICFVQPKTISKMFCICQDLVTGAPLQTRSCPRHDFSIVWEHRWLSCSVLGGLNNVLAREALERRGTQAPTLHLSVDREPGVHVTHHKARGGFSGEPSFPGAGHWLPSLRPTSWAKHNSAFANNRFLLLTTYISQWAVWGWNKSFPQVFPGCFVEHWLWRILNGFMRKESKLYQLVSIWQRQSQASGFLYCRTAQSLWSAQV